MLINHINKLSIIALNTEILKRINEDSVIMKIVLAILVLFFFNGCAQHVSLLGPFYTLGTTGNALQAGVSYGSSHAIKKLRSKNASQKINNSLKENSLKENRLKDDLKENSDEFFNAIKTYVKRSNRIEVLINQ
jgi:hypothetical protein